MLLTAMRWLYRKKIAVFENLGYSWEDLLDHFKVGMAKSIASFHVALAVPESVVRAYVKLIRYVFTSYLPRDLYTTTRSIFFPTESDQGTFFSQFTSSFLHALCAF